MKIVIRADASTSLGSGHVMRCLTLADALRTRGNSVLFISREEQGNCFDIIKACGFETARLAATVPFNEELDAEATRLAIGGRVDWIIVDHYRLSALWERRVRSGAEGVMVIDDLADRPHHCELLLDQNLYDDMSTRYDGLVPDSCRLFLGPTNALLREEFIVQRRGLRRSRALKRLLLSFGGSDPTNETEKALIAMEQLQRPDLQTDVVVGSANAAGERIRALCAALPNTSFHRQVSNMAQLMAEADLCIGAGGATTWERCYLGLPSLVVTVAENQVAAAEVSHRAGIIRLLGRSEDVSAKSLAWAMSDALSQPERMAEMSERCLDFMKERDAAVHGDILDLLMQACRR